MHYLVWDQHKFKVEYDKDKSKTQKNSEPDLLDRPWVRLSSGQVSQTLWEEFVENNAVCQHMDSLLLDSWQRCYQVGVDPSPRKCWDFLDGSELDEAQGKIKDLIRPIEKTLYKLASEQNLTVNLANEKGYIINTFGNPKALKLSNQLNFGPGANWSEESVGTNAVGTALVTGQPVQIFDQEHYCQSHHNWRCTAAPFYTAFGELAGVFDISGASDFDHNQALSIVLWASQAIEQQLFINSSQKINSLSKIFMGALPSGLPAGFIFLDQFGQMLEACNRAYDILGPRLMLKLQGDCREVFDLDSYLRMEHNNPSYLDKLPIKCLLQPEIKTSIKKLSSPLGNPLGYLLTVLEPRARKRTTVQIPVHESKAVPFVYKSQESKDLIQLVKGFAQTNSTVLIQGETGTGKELLARLLHQEGPRHNKPFIPVNCGAVSPKLIQSEFFGYVGGAFTGADAKGRAGLFEKADGGIIFLDEISELPLDMQANLLRVLEDKTVTRVGDHKSRQLDIKILAATNRDLKEEAANGNFREDLYYRLNVAKLRVLPLRERRDDIDVLTDFHWDRLTRENNIPTPTIDEEARQALNTHHWQGNVRALVNALEYALNRLYAFDFDILSLDHLPENILEKSHVKGEAKKSLENQELDIIVQTIEKCGGNISKAARKLGIGRTTIYTKLKKIEELESKEASL